MKRGVGYCDNVECEDYFKGVFLLNHSDTFYCPRCRGRGFAEAETFTVEGKSDLYYSVRVEFMFDPASRKYREIAIVSDDSLLDGSEYILKSPLVKTEKRALALAESILARLAYANADAVRDMHDTVISLDGNKEEFRKQLDALEEMWYTANNRRNTNA